MSIDRMLNQFIAFGAAALVAVAGLMAWTFYEDAKQPIPGTNRLFTDYCAAYPDECQPTDGATP